MVNNNHTPEAEEREAAGETVALSRGSQADDERSQILKAGLGPTIQNGKCRSKAKSYSVQQMFFLSF